MGKEKVEKLNRGLKKVVTSDNGGQTFAVHYGTQKGEKRFRIYRIDPALRYLPVEMQPSAFTEYVTGGKYLKIFRKTRFRMTPSFEHSGTYYRPLARS